MGAPSNPAVVSDRTVRIVRWSLLAFVVMVSGVAAQAATAGQAVTAAEHQWLKSQQTNNVELLAPLLADKVVETTTEGKVIVGKDAMVADAKSGHWSSAEYTDLKVTVSPTASLEDVFRHYTASDLSAQAETSGSFREIRSSRKVASRVS